MPRGHTPVRLVRSARNAIIVCWPRSSGPFMAIPSCWRIPLRAPSAAINHRARTCVVRLEACSITVASTPLSTVWNDFSSAPLRSCPAE